MTYDPLSSVRDEPLLVGSHVIAALRAFRAAPKLESQTLLSTLTDQERQRLSPPIDRLTDELIEGVAANSSKLWVMAAFQRTLSEMNFEDTEVREQFGMELETLMDILRIDSSDGLLAFYLG